MLTGLQIKNFAIIDHVELEFGGGMTVLTGETGAGKSILVDALGLVLGERGSSGLVRNGTKRAEISAEFDIANLPVANSWIEEHALDSDGECLLRRVINADGRSRAFINGNAVPLQNLKLLGEMLLDIHGQHFHQSLGRRNVQRDLLDHYAAALALRSDTESAFNKWQELARELASLQAADAERASRLDLLTFQTNELEMLDVQPDEGEQLLSDRRRLQNSGRLTEGVADIMQSIYDADSGNVQSLIADACQSLESLSELDDKLAPVLTLLNEASIQVSEAADSLRRYSDSLDMDPAERDRVEDRLDSLQTAARKHRVEISELPALKEKLQQQLHDIQHADELGAALQENTEAAKTSYRKAADKLSKARRKAAANFSLAITNTMASLGMSGGVFKVDVKNTDADDPKPYGIDVIDYMISANPGQPPMPLAKVASGGELSRMSLSIQVIASDGSPIPTMVFDEVDSGVGGGVAEMVGKRLRDVAKTRQVFCVTHLAQVASVADHHFKIAKITDGQSTRTSVNSLTKDERVEELARMLGGVKITERTRDHAAERLETGEKHGSGKSAKRKRA